MNVRLKAALTVMAALLSLLLIAMGVVWVGEEVDRQTMSRIVTGIIALVCVGWMYVVALDYYRSIEERKESKKRPTGRERIF